MRVRCVSKVNVTQQQQQQMDLHYFVFFSRAPVRLRRRLCHRIRTVVKWLLFFCGQHSPQFQQTLVWSCCCCPTRPVYVAYDIQESARVDGGSTALCKCLGALWLRLCRHLRLPDFLFSPPRTLIFLFFFFSVFSVIRSLVMAVAVLPVFLILCSCVFVCTCAFLRETEMHCSQVWPSRCGAAGLACVVLVALVVRPRTASPSDEGPPTAWRRRCGARRCVCGVQECGDAVESPSSCLCGVDCSRVRRGLC